MTLTKLQTMSKRLINLFSDNRNKGLRPADGIWQNTVTLFLARVMSGCSWWCNCRAVAQKSLSLDLLRQTNPEAKAWFGKKGKGVYILFLEGTSVLIQLKKREHLAKCLMMECPEKNMRSIRSRWWRKSKSETLLKALAIQAHSIQEVFHNVVNSSEY